MNINLQGIMSYLPPEEGRQLLQLLEGLATTVQSKNSILDANAIVQRMKEGPSWLLEQEARDRQQQPAFNIDAASAEIDQLLDEQQRLMTNPSANLARLEQISQRTDELHQGIQKQQAVDRSAFQAKHAEEQAARGDKINALSAEIEQLNVNPSVNYTQIVKLQGQLDQELQQFEAIESGQGE